jgi:hypothetical protein
MAGARVMKIASYIRIFLLVLVAMLMQACGWVM